MESLFTYVAPPSPCGYLPEQSWSLEYEYVGDVTAAEYERRMQEGWRHFGRMLFHHHRDVVGLGGGGRCLGLCQ